MIEETHEKLPFSTLALGGAIVVAAWFVLFLSIPFMFVPAALSNNSVLDGIVVRLNLTAIGYAVLLARFAKNRVSNAQFWRATSYYVASWIIISCAGEWFAEYVYTLRDRDSIDTANALITTLINTFTFIGPAIYTAIKFKHLLFRQDEGKARISKEHSDGVGGFKNPNMQEGKWQMSDMTSSDDRFGIPTETPRPTKKPASAKQKADADPPKKQINPQKKDPATPSKESEAWSEDFSILFEYDPDVKKCHEELEGIDLELSSQFRLEVVSDRKKSLEICDRIKAAHEKKLNPYASDELNEGLSQARLLGPKAEEEFIRVVKVMGEDVDPNPIIEKLTKKYSGGTEWLDEKFGKGITYGTMAISGDVQINDAYGWACDQGAEWAHEFERIYVIDGDEMDVSETRKIITRKILGKTIDYRGYQILIYKGWVFVDDKRTQFANADDAKKQIDVVWRRSGQ
jgi:hypothetical protein